jgi:tRNA-specific 2-thiouridylase
MPKGRVRELATEFNLPNARKRDSQGICFLGTISVEDFLRREFGNEPGEALDETGNHIGKHDGAVLHTLGERVRLEGADAGPWYVVRKDIAQNVLVVSHERYFAKDATAKTSAIPLVETNWLEAVAADEQLEAQYRYHGPRIAGTLDQAAGTFIPAQPLSEPIASGQSLVIYRNEACIGGGIIG